MRIGTIASWLGTTPEAIRFYERSGLLPDPVRTTNGYRDYTDQDTARLRLLIGLRSLDLPLDQAASLATMCAVGRCDEVSAELRAVLAAKRSEVARRIEELHFLDGRLAHLAGQLGEGASPRDAIPGKEG
ncbi:MAG: MerR family transcriptional regulator [Chloroflexi bacterium]|nr:MerR family transcriptional regulator [Chloroflexota bacterium]